MSQDKIDIPEYFTIHCTNNDKTAEAQLIWQRGDTILATINTVPLMFKRLKPRIWVANFQGMEFVYKEK